PDAGAALSLRRRHHPRLPRRPGESGAVGSRPGPGPHPDPPVTRRAGDDPGPPPLFRECLVKATHTIRPHLLTALLLGASAVACNGAEGKSKGAAAGAGGGGAMPPMPVEVVAARSDTVVDAILATGQIEAMQSVELRPDIEGRIAEILVREGAMVARGAPLFKGDDAELPGEVAQAHADGDIARQSLARTRELLGQKASSQSELEHAEAT